MLNFIMLNRALPNEINYPLTTREINNLLVKTLSFLLSFLFFFLIN